MGELLPHTAVHNALTKPLTLTDERRAALRHQLQVLRAKQPRCTQILPTGKKCDGIARKGTGYCFNHDPSDAGKAKRQRTHDHLSAAAKLRRWEMRQLRVAEVDPTRAYSLGYRPANQEKPRASRRVPVQ